MTSLPSLSVLNLPEPVMSSVVPQTQKQSVSHSHTHHHSHLTYTHLPAPVGGPSGNGLSQYSFDKPGTHNTNHVTHNIVNVTHNTGNVTHNTGNVVPNHTHHTNHVTHNTANVVPNHTAHVMPNTAHVMPTHNTVMPTHMPTPPMNPPTPTPSELPASPATQIHSPATSPPLVSVSQQQQHHQQPYPTSVPHSAAVPATMLTPLYTPEASRRNSTEKEYFGVMSQNMPQNLHLHQQHIQQQLQQQQMHQQQQQQQYYPHGYRQASLSPPQHYPWDTNQPQMMGLAPSHELKQKMHKRQVRKRTKTGCMACRKRRIKCDEAKPSCFNCAKSKRDCMGYALVPM